MPTAFFPKKSQSWLPSCSIIHPPQLMITQDLISGVFQHLRCEMPIFASLALQEICRTRSLKHVSSSFFVYISLRACWLLKNLFRWCSNALHEKALRFVLSSLARLPCDLLLSLWATYKKMILIHRSSSTLGPLSATSRSIPNIQAERSVPKWVAGGCRAARRLRIWRATCAARLHQPC